MIGTYMGKFLSPVYRQKKKLPITSSYMAAEVGFPIAAENGVYSSDSTPFADRWGSGCFVCAYCQRKCRPDSLPLRCQRCDVDGAAAKDIDFLTVFTGRFANAAVCRVAREIPETIRKQLDEYLFRKRKRSLIYFGSRIRSSETNCKWEKNDSGRRETMKNRTGRNQAGKRMPLAEMVALFRVELRSYKGIASKPNVEDGREEMKEYLLAGFPVFAATVHGESRRLCCLSY